jgi:5-methylcytosine-specific restriction enzyme subunit McrC
VEIPIQNLYYLLCYAWDRLEEGEVVDVASETPKDVANLLARVLVNGTQHLMRRGLDRGYVAHEEETARLRGRLDFATTTKRLLHVQGRAHCHYDELTPDVLHNRILRTTLRRLAQVEGIDSAHYEALFRLYRQMEGITEVPVSTRTFGLVQLHSGNAFYRFLLTVCALVHESILVSEATGSYRFRDFTRDEVAMRRVFEQFVASFYLREQSGYRVRPQRRILWDAEALAGSSPDLLPNMYADVVLEPRSGAGRTIVLDTKYTPKVFQTYRETSRFRSGHLYQMHAYLEQLAAEDRREGHQRELEGLLLYPTASVELDHRYRFGGHHLRLRTLNLNRDWQAIHEDLLSLLDR